MNLAVLGAGAWGTAIAVHACTLGQTVRLWARDPTQAEAMRALRTNGRYLPDVALPDKLEISAELDAVLDACDLVLVATPMAALGTVLGTLPPSLGAVLWLCKGFDPASGALGHEVASAVLPHAALGVLSGPSFALEVARGQPTALVAASADAGLRRQAVAALHGGSMRVYTSGDPIGVEVGGAVKNVLAIATGIADGLGVGLNARAALITRGLAEMTRLAVALGAEPETLTGLSGLGDLVLTATGALSRNRTVGLQLARGLPLAQILRELAHVAEGVRSAAMVWQRAQTHGVEMPITGAVVAVLDGTASPQQAMQRLMGREARPES